MGIDTDTDTYMDILIDIESDIDVDRDMEMDSGFGTADRAFLYRDPKTKMLNTVLLFSAFLLQISCYSGIKNTKKSFPSANFFL
jgi:hypothetical protein